MNKIKSDPRNARIHGERNRSTIRKSLSELGPGRSILIDNDDVTVAGNGVLNEAEALGIPIRIVESDGSELIAVKRTDLSRSNPKRIALALADNRCSDLSEFNDDNVAELLRECEQFADAAGFDLADREKLFAPPGDEPECAVNHNRPEVDFSEELLECHNYIVLFFDNDIDWLQALTLFRLKTVKDSYSKPGYERRGVGRVIRGADAINRITGAQ